jgi:hypothetical protein
VHVGARRAAAIGAALSLAAVLALTLTPGPPNVVTPQGFCIVCGTTGGQDFFDNILLFAPLGFFLRLAGVRRWKVLAASVALTCFVEAMQYHVIAGRDASVGDVVANSLGGAAGLLLADGWRRLVFPGPRLARRLAAAGAAGWLAVLAVTAWALGPAPLPDAPRTTSFAPVDQRWSVFHGQVLAASLDGNRLAPGPLGPLRPAAAGPYASYHSDAMSLEVVVTNGNKRATFAPIVRVAAPFGPNDRIGDGDEIVAIGENECDAEYHVRLRASALRLPSPGVTVPRVFPCGDATDAARGVREGDTTVVAGTVRDSRRGGRTLRVSAVWTRGRRSTAQMVRELPLTPGLGWSFFLPWHFEFGIRPYALLTALWLGGLLLPVGYWAGRGRGASRRAPMRLAVLVAVGALALVAAGLAGVAAASGLATPAPSDWAASLAGLAVGWITGARTTSETDGSRVTRERD